MTTESTQPMTRRPLLSAATLIGIGMGGFIDGIVLHQLLQVHSMLSARLPPRESVQNMEVNMFWDGLFHSFSWIMTAAGILMLWRAARRVDVPWSPKTFYGGMLLGWAVFNLVEGVLDHHILHLHHVIEGPGHLPWDLAFLGVSALMLAAAVLIIRAGRRDTPLPRAHS